MSEFRIERDSMGDVRVPAKAYYGAQTQRAVENFPISGWQLPPALIHALGLVKLAAALANRELGKLTGSGKNPLNEKQVDGAPGRLPRSGRRALRRPVSDRRLPDRLRHVEQHERQRGDQQPGHRAVGRRPLQRQTSRSIPTTTSTWGKARTTCSPRRSTWRSARAIENDLIPALERLRRGACAARRANGTRSSRSAARTWPMPRPLRLGQEFGGFARQLRALGRASRAGAAGRAGIAGRRHGRRHRHQHASRVRPPRRRGAGQRNRHPLRRSCRIISRPTPSATAWSSATASCARSPPRSSTWPTTFAGSARARGAASTKSCCPTGSRAARSCRARSTR